MEDTGTYKEVFNTEIDGWCFGLSQFAGEIHQALVHRTIRELAPSFREAIIQGVDFDIIELAKKFSRAARSLVSTKEIAFTILYNLPNPKELNEDAQLQIAQIVDRLESQYGGALAPMEQRWKWQFKQNPQNNKQAA